MPNRPLDYSLRFAPSFFAQDPLVVARGLLGAFLVHNPPGHAPQIGMVVETEAYRGEEDQACHARVGRTSRTEIMYGEPGRAYVYLIYGMYHMLNVVTWPANMPSAVLLRGLAPLEGIQGTTDGPGKLCRALTITRAHNGTNLLGDTLFLVPGEKIPADDIATGPRVGIDYAGDWAARPWRFALKGSPYVSKPRL